MAQVYTAYFRQIAFAASKSMAMVQNVDGTKVVKILRIGLINNSFSGGTGQLCSMEVRAYQDVTSCYFQDNASTYYVYPFFHDKSNDYPEKVICATNGILTGSANVLRRIFWSSDETANSASTNEELEAVIPLNIIFDSAYGDSNIQPLTLRTGEFVSVHNVSGASASVDIYIEFEIE